MFQGRSRDPRRRATVGYSHNRSMDYEGTTSEVEGPTFHRGGFIRSSLPAARSPPTLDKPAGMDNCLHLNRLWQTICTIVFSVRRASTFLLKHLLL